MGARQKGKKLWQGGIVPYEINPDLGNIVSIESAIKTFEEQTNVRFVGASAKVIPRPLFQTNRWEPTFEGRPPGGRQFLDASLNELAP